ncbi:glycosyl hydrolase 115 family protein [uncultured Bacteroides sp.]|uniref:glycosyl hydrolase 115 family protein n=1 Tax=uncultured Bacteroides sp. TaxID=162156 RepID=UPI0025D8CD96|nr:glycosyl hydrolase 115 family protein [uncultured Bacteroides sp.]
MKKPYILIVLLFISVFSNSANQFISFKRVDGSLQILKNGKVVNIIYDNSDQKGISIAINNLVEDFNRVCGVKPELLDEVKDKNCIIIGSIESKYIRQLIKSKKLDKKELQGKSEKYIITTVDNPLEGVDKALVIAGSDRRGTIYGIYELSEQMGVSPWYWWMDVPVEKHTEIYAMPGVYTDGEPAVKYRGIFLNDEAPCLTSWVNNHYGTDFGDHRFYADVFELILRLKGNFLWPAMWGWAFYADDPLNSKTADEMGVIISTSHHEPMARNHQEWARKRKEYGAWNYSTNKKVIDQFFREGIERVKDTEDIITIGMRGDGDEAMSEDTNVKLLESVVENQRKIIKEVTGKPAKETPQLWALYKEVLDYYDKGMRVPEDVIMLLCDDNWGNVRRLPNEKERLHPGGWGMYYHVDYVGAPRNSKWMNMTPIQGMWEQLHLTYEYGVDRLWVLNVGDLKPMEYPIEFFLDMAWNPDAYTAENFMEHARKFCVQSFGESQADEAARILNLYTKYNGRVTAEMLDAKTYNLETGEWKQVADDYARLEMEALRQYMSLSPEYRDAYKQLLLYPVQAMSNLYEMYYAQAMNHKLYADGNPMANLWADKVEKCFARDKALSDDYNNVMAEGKWKGMMIQKHIGYTSWNDNFPADKLPEVKRIAEAEKAVGGYVFTGKNGYVAMEAPHFYENNAPEGTEWKIIPDMGRTLGGVTLMPYTKSAEGASLSYKMQLPEGVKDVKVIVVVKSTLAFADVKGHEYTVGFRGGNTETVNFNHNMNEDKENVYTVFYPTVARRVIEKEVNLELPVSEDSTYVLDFKPLHPAVVLEKIVVDYGGYSKSYLYMNESDCKRN